MEFACPSHLPPSRNEWIYSANALKYALDFVLHPDSLCFFIFFCTEYEIVSPYEVNHEGIYISHEVAHHQRRRRVRSLTSDTGSSQADSGSQKVHFQLSGLGQDFHIELWEASENLFAPGFTIQVLGKRGTKSLRAYQREDLCFYQGSLRSRVNSSVALSTCMGMVSLNTFRLVCFGV